jgi:hypothetical protein
LLKPPTPEFDWIDRSFRFRVQYAVIYNHRVYDTAKKTCGLLTALRIVGLVMMGAALAGAIPSSVVQAEPKDR